MTAVMVSLEIRMRGLKIRKEFGDRPLHLCVERNKLIEVPVDVLRSCSTGRRLNPLECLHVLSGLRKITLKSV